ncbi:DUF533 domain-containing protein [Methylopila sp. M107]|uniref:tellurite resistance TerB family protein n=1 Tax=Methylopila sp. M107 TaxID=1101190 RepID=UPI000381B2A2|nr:DUF533 domain-containing protein [Methylopila sp. M107]
MLDAKKILDQFLGAGAAAGSGSRPGGGGGGLADVVGGALSRLGGGSGAPGVPAPRQDAPAPAQGGGDLRSQIEGLAKGNLGGVAGGAIAGTLASILMGSGKKSLPISNSALKLGGLAILGGLAYKAWQNYQEKQAPPAPQPQAGPVQIAPPPQQTAFSPDTPDDEQNLGQLLVRVMIAAARADGRIDGAEIARIREAIRSAGGDVDEQAFLIENLGRADDLDAIAAEARGPELRSELWLAARLTIEPDTAAEQAFLKTFAQKLGLDSGLVAHLDATAAQAKQSGVAAA